jgi:predicted DNA-binding ribbon-helix-helix protein
MKLNVLRPWQVGDTVSLTESQLKQLEIDGHYDSYDRAYEFEKAKWKIVSQMARRDGQTDYMLECVEVPTGS